MRWNILNDFSFFCCCWMASFTWADIHMFGGVYTNFILTVIGNDHCYLWFQLNWIFLRVRHFHDNFFFFLKETWNEFQFCKICWATVKILFDINVSQFVKFWKFNIHFQCWDSTLFTLIAQCSVSHLSYTICCKNQSHPLS